MESLLVEAGASTSPIFSDNLLGLGRIILSEIGTGKF